MRRGRLEWWWVGGEVEAAEMRADGGACQQRRIAARRKSRAVAKECAELQWAMRELRELLLLADVRRSREAAAVVRKPLSAGRWGKKIGELHKYPCTPTTHGGVSDAATPTTTTHCLLCTRRYILDKTCIWEGIYWSVHASLPVVV